MTRTVLYLVIGAVLISGCISVHETKRVDDKRPCPEKVEPRPCQLLRHVVLLKLKDESSAEDIKKIENAFAALPSKVDAIYDFEWGTDVSVENRQEGFTHCFVVTFRSEEDRAKYLPHPEHKKFGGILGPHLDKVLVIDYWAK